MIFNVLANNRDDHVKNFAFLLDDTVDARGVAANSTLNFEWTATPAYDMLYTPGPGGEHSMTLAGEGQNQSRSHMLALAEAAGVSKREALAIIEAIRAAIARWPEHAARAGVSQANSRRIETELPELPS